jgi:hypothetical protein
MSEDGYSKYHCRDNGLKVLDANWMYALLAKLPGEYALIFLQNAALVIAAVCGAILIADRSAWRDRLYGYALLGFAVTWSLALLVTS